MRRLDKFIDEKEGKLEDNISDSLEFLFHEFPNSQEMQSQLRNLLKNIRKVSFTNCWHLNTNENIEMWKNYCGLENGVVVKTKVENLVESIFIHDLGPMHFRPVTYAQETIQNIDLRFPMELINYKSSQYRFENEFRVTLLYTKIDKELEDIEEFEEVEINAPENEVKLKVDLNKLIQEVIISPFANEEFRERINALCNSSQKFAVTDSKLSRN